MPCNTEILKARIKQLEKTFKKSLKQIRELDELCHKQAKKLEAYEKELEWQRILKAPKDGSLILLSTPTTVRINYWNKDLKRWTAPGLAQAHEGLISPMGWKPLPKPIKLVI